MTAKKNTLMMANRTRRRKKYKINIPNLIHTGKPIQF